MEKKGSQLDAGSSYDHQEEKIAVSRFHILAVDDSLIDRKVIERLLKVSGYKVTTVESGRRALEFLGFDNEQPNSGNTDRVKVNMIITDYNMPGMTGYELLKKIKTSSTLKEIPVVILSSEKLPARIERCWEEGAEEFIPKPLKLSDVSRLKRHIVKRMPTSPKRKTACDRPEIFAEQHLSEKRQRHGGRMVLQEQMQRFEGRSVA